MCRRPLVSWALGWPPSLAFHALDTLGNTGPVQCCSGGFAGAVPGSAWVPDLGKDTLRPGAFLTGSRQQGAPLVAPLDLWVGRCWPGLSCD